VESRHPSAHLSGVNTQIRSRSLDVVTSLEASFFGVLEATFWLSMLAPLVWVEVFGYRQCASVAGLLIAACLTPRSLKGLAVSFGSDFPSRDVDRSVVVLAVAIVLVLFDGASYLVQLGRVAKCVVFASFP
jgi:hypothetical protein